MSSQSFRGESSLSAMDTPRSNSAKEPLNKESVRKSNTFEGSSSASQFNDDEFRNLDVIVTSLGSHSVNWIKKRRSVNSHAKVAMTFQSERRLRKIFDGFDFDKSGSVSLDEFHHALDFCRQNKSFHRLSKKLDDLEKVCTRICLCFILFYYFQVMCLFDFRIRHLFRWTQTAMRL
jgi:hypothetical protein